MGEKLVSFETSGKKVEYISKERCNDSKYSYGYSKDNVYFMLHRKYLQIEEYKTLVEKGEYEYLYRKLMS